MLSLGRIGALALLLVAVQAQAESHYWGGQRALTEIDETTEINGNFGFGGNFYTNYNSYMNANGCPTATWRACSMSDIREAMANRVTGWENLAGGASFGCSWVNGYDLAGVPNYSVITPGATTNCSGWNSTAGFGLAFCPMTGTASGEFGFRMMACNRPRTLLCCR